MNSTNNGRRAVIAGIVGILVFILSNILGIDVPVEIASQTIDLVDGAIALATTIVTAFQTGKWSALRVRS